jgi:hypothetical protein
MKARSSSGAPALRVALSVAALVLSCATLAGCARDKRKAAEAQLEKFEVSIELPPEPGKPAPAPPDAALEPFRVWVNQETPRQKKNPEWQAVPAKEGKILDLAADGNWRCLVNPAKVFGKIDEDRTVTHWTVSRTLRCSSDNWRTSTEGLVRVGYAPDGTRGEVDPRAAFYLKDIVAGVPRVTVVVMEPAKGKASLSAPN